MEDKQLESRNESLNKWKKKDKEMKRLYKKDYEALEHYVEKSRIDILKEKQDKKYPISKETENRLINEEYIDFNEKANNLYNLEHIITISGEKRYVELREEWRKNVTLYVAIGILVVAIITWISLQQSNREIINLINSTLINLTR